MTPSAHPLRRSLPANAGLLTAVLMLWHLGRPALWLDESASTVAREHTWPHLWRLLQGSDAPLVPYYAVLKALDAAAVAAVPALSHHSAVLGRWPSVLAAVVAVTLMTAWVQRIASTTAATAGAALLMLTTGLSRYGQEARPYAVVLMLAVVATVLWWAAIQAGRAGNRWRWPGYALVVAALVSLHVLAAILVVVHVAAAPLVRADAPSTRRRRTLLTTAFAVAGLLLAAPLTFVAVRNGRGATAFTHDNVRDLLKAAGADVVGQGSHPLWLAAGLVLLCLVGVTRWSSPHYGDLVRVTTLWTVVPLLAWAAATRLQPNLLIGRYILFALPAFTTLASIGLLSVAGWLTCDARPYLAGALMLPPLIVVAVLQAPALATVRATAGHSEDIRPVLAVTTEPPYRDLPVYVSPPNDLVEVQAADPAVDRRVLNAAPRWGSKSIWPAHTPRHRLRFRLAKARDVIFVVRKDDCLPGLAVALGYRVVADLGNSGHTWFAFLAARGASGPQGARPRLSPGRWVARRSR